VTGCPAHHRCSLLGGLTSCASAAAQAVGLTFYGEGEPQNQLLEYLHEKTLLLILDNFEYVLDGAALVNTILAYAPGVKVLATSREVLSLQEEWLYPLNRYQLACLPTL
jgi:predicted ATPase